MLMKFWILRYPRAARLARWMLWLIGLPIEQHFHESAHDMALARERVVKGRLRRVVLGGEAYSIHCLET